MTTGIYALFICAAFFDACMDAFENTPNFNESIFKNWNKKFWCKDESWAYVRKILGYRFDGWHIVKSLMWLCVIVAAIVAWYAPKPELPWIIHFCGLAGTWNLAFPFFYHVIFKIK